MTTPTKAAWAWMLVVMASLGCLGGQSGTEGESPIRCDVVATRTVGADEQTTAGTAEQIAGVASMERRVPMRWHVHGEMPSFSDTELTSSATSDLSSARLIERRPGENATPQLCPPMLEIDATLHLESADGAFAESIAGTLRKEGQQSAVFTGTLPVELLAGTYDAAWTEPIYADPVMHVLQRYDDTTAGQINLSGMDKDDDPSTGVTSAWIAEWPRVTP